MTGLLGGWQDPDTDYNFVEPGAQKSFGEKLHNFATTDLSIGGWTGFNALVANKNGEQDALIDTLDTAHRQALYSGNLSSRATAAEDGYTMFNKRVQLLTGVQLENPLLGGYGDEAAQRLRDAGGGPRDLNTDFSGDITRVAADIYQEKLHALRRDNRDVADQLTFNQANQATALAERADVDAQAAAGKPLGGVVRFGAQLAGGMAGSRYDPVFMSSLLAGPAGAAGKTALSRIAMSALTQGAYNAGLTAMEQPVVQQWRREVGLRNGVQPAIEEVGMAFLAGAIPGAAIHGASELMHGMRPQISRVMDGTATAAETRTVLETLDPPAAAELQPVLRQAADSEVATGQAQAEPFPGTAPADHDAAFTQAVRSATDDTLPPPEGPVITRPAPADDILSERMPAPAAGVAVTVDGKPASFERFDPRQLGTDAAAFQYKGGGDAAGVTDRLKGVQKWDPIASSKVMVFEKLNGDQIIADGHQRLGLAQRLTENGKAEAPVLDGFLFKESDGWTPADVRALAARKNMQEGSGTPLDAARVLRDRPELLDASLPISSPAMKQAIGLSKLSDEGFGMVINGAVPENYAAAVGQLAPDPLTHSAILQDLIRAAPQTEREARFLIGDALAAGFHVEEQINLFGAGELTRTLLGERASVMSNAIKALNADKKLFGILAERADIIEAAGNSLARATNEERAQSAALVGDLIMRLAQRTGPVSDLLNAAARRVAEGDIKPGAAGKEFLTGVRKQLDEGGLAALLAEPRLAPERVVEPGSKEALAAAEGPQRAPAQQAAAEKPAWQLDANIKDDGIGSISSTDDKRSGDLSFRLTPDALKVGTVSVSKAERGKGLGIALYEKALSIAQEHGVPLRSDFSVSQDAARIYEALQRRGYDVRISQDVTRNEKGAQITKVGGSVYEVSPTLPAGDVDRMPDLFDAVPLSDRESGADTVVSSAQTALDAADRIGFTADIVDLCTRL